MELRNTPEVLLDYLKLTDTKIKFLKKKFAQLNEYSDTSDRSVQFTQKNSCKACRSICFADDVIFEKEI